jgi:hypothetical protein
VTDGVCRACGMKVNAELEAALSYRRGGHR